MVNISKDANILYYLPSNVCNVSLLLISQAGTHSRSCLCHHLSELKRASDLDNNWGADTGAQTSIF